MEVQLCFPHLVNSSCRRPRVRSELTLLQTALCCVSVLTVALNLLLIVSISHFRQLLCPTNVLLLSLAVSDFLVGLVLMPAEIARQTSCWFLGDLVCSLYNYVALAVTSASIGDMVLISADRYVAVCHPLHYSSRVTVRRVQFGVCVCWLCSVLYSALIALPDLMHPGQNKLCHGECVVFIDDITGAVDLVVSFIVPVSVIVVLYVRVFVVAVSQARAVRSRVAAVTQKPSVKSELKAARALGVVVLVFLACFCPFYCVGLAGQHVLSSASGAFVLFLFCFNSCLNPVIYASFYPWFRKSIRLIMSLQVLQPGSQNARLL